MITLSTLFSNPNTLYLTIGVVAIAFVFGWLAAAKKNKTTQPAATPAPGDDAATALAIAAAMFKPAGDESPVALAIAAALFKPAGDESPLALAIAAAAFRPPEDGAPVALALAAAARR